MLKVCFCEKQVDGLTASCQILTSKKDSIKPPYGEIFGMRALAQFHRFRKMYKINTKHPLVSV
jgi:hypothetical protein